MSHLSRPPPSPCDPHGMTAGIGRTVKRAFLGRIDRIQGGVIRTDARENRAKFPAEDGRRKTRGIPPTSGRVPCPSLEFLKCCA